MAFCNFFMIREKCVSIHSYEKKNHKIGTQVYKIQILSRYLKIISNLCTF